MQFWSTDCMRTAYYDPGGKWCAWHWTVCYARCANVMFACVVWLGAGEAAGLRVMPHGLQPPGNRDAAWVAYGCVFKQHTWGGGHTGASHGSSRLDATLVEAAAGMSVQRSSGPLRGAYKRYNLPEDRTDGGITWAVGKEAVAT